MRVEFLSFDLDEATVTCGIWWWRRQAVCALFKLPPFSPGNPYGGVREVWRYQNSGTDCHWRVRKALEMAVSLELERRRIADEKARFEMDWLPVRRARKTLPPAMRTVR